MVFIESQKRLKEAADFEARTLEQIAERLKALDISEILIMRHAASSAGVYGCTGQYFELITPGGGVYSFYTSEVYNDFDSWKELQRLNNLLKE